MVITAGEIIEKARYVLKDNGAAPRWTNAEALLWITAGQRAIVKLKPSANVVQQSVQLSAGVEQAVAGYLLLDIPMNVDSTGVPSQPVARIDLQTLNNLFPEWTSAPAKTTVVYYMYSPEINPAVFFVYPPQPSNGFGSVVMVTSMVPAKLLSVTSLIMNDAYDNELVNYLLYRAYAKEGGEQALVSSKEYYGHFMEGVGADIKNIGDINGAPEPKK